MTVIDRLDALLKGARPLPWDLVVGRDDYIDPADEALALAAVNALPKLLRVARAAEARVMHWHSRGCPSYPMLSGDPVPECRCGHEKLRAALADLAKEETT